VTACLHQSFLQTGWQVHHFQSDEMFKFWKAVGVQQPPPDEVCSGSLVIWNIMQMYFQRPQIWHEGQITLNHVVGISQRCIFQTNIILHWQE